MFWGYNFDTNFIYVANSTREYIEIPISKRIKYIYWIAPSKPENFTDFNLNQLITSSSNNQCDDLLVEYPTILPRFLMETFCLPNALQIDFKLSRNEGTKWAFYRKV